MGSFLGHAKGDNKAPLISRMVEHNRKYNESCQRRWNASPWWRKVLFCCGFKQQAYDWAFRQPLDIAADRPVGGLGYDKKTGEIITTDSPLSKQESARREATERP
jgi:hypothetical protein